MYLGGGEKIQSILSLSYDEHKGTLLNTWTKKFSGKLQTNFNITKWLKLYERVSFDVSDGQGDVPTNHQGPIMGAIWYPRSAPVYEMNQDGSYALDAFGNRYFGTTERPGTGSTTLPEHPDIRGNRSTSKNILKVFIAINTKHVSRTKTLLREGLYPVSWSGIYGDA